MFDATALLDRTFVGGANRRLLFVCGGDVVALVVGVVEEEDALAPGLPAGDDVC